MANLTWQEKLEKGLPLNELESVKEAAHRITLRRIADAKEEAERAAARLHPQPVAKVEAPAPAPAEAVAEAPKETSPQNSKKGN